MIRVYLDTNIWGRPFNEQKLKRIQMESDAFFKILEGAYYQQKYEIIGSLILDDEIEQIEGMMKKDAAKALVDLFVAKKIRDFSISLLKALKILGLKEKDMMHLAFAIDNADYFITCDDEIVNKKKEIEEQFKIKVVNPVEFVKEVL